MTGDSAGVAFAVAFAVAVGLAVACSRGVQWGAVKGAKRTSAPPARGSAPSEARRGAEAARPRCKREGERRSDRERSEQRRPPATSGAERSDVDGEPGVPPPDWCRGRREGRKARPAALWCPSGAPAAGHGGGCTGGGLRRHTDVRSAGGGTTTSTRTTLRLQLGVRWAKPPDAARAKPSGRTDDACQEGPVGAASTGATGGLGGSAQ